MPGSHLGPGNLSYISKPRELLAYLRCYLSGVGLPLLPRVKSYKLR